MIKAIKYMRGYVCLRIWGYSPERFMNLCSNHGILLWDIENHGEYYTMCVSVDGFFCLKPCLKKTKTKAAIIKRCGLPFLVPKMKKRKFFGFGLICCLVFLLTMSRFLWAVDFLGNQAITDDILMDFLTRSGIHYGMKKKDIDIEALEASLRENYDLITWTSIRIDGTKLTVQIKENETVTVKQQTEEVPEGQGMDLVADGEGVITSIITRSGVPNVSVGDTVQPGDVLVYGRVPIYNEDTTIKRFDYCKSDADIFMQCGYPVNEVLPGNYKAKLYTGSSKRNYFAKVFNKEYMLPQKSEFLKSDCVIEEKQFCILKNLYLPFSVGCYEYREYMIEEKSYQEQEAEVILQERLSKIILTLEEKGVQIIEKNVKIDTDYDPEGNNYILSGSFTVIRPAGILKETQTDE